MSSIKFILGPPFLKKSSVYYMVFDSSLWQISPVEYIERERKKKRKRTGEERGEERKERGETLIMGDRG